MPRFDQSFSGLCEQNLQDTLQLKQRYLDAKAKRPPKAKDKKQLTSSDLTGQQNQQQQQQSASIQSSVHVQQKFLKRPASEESQSNSNTSAGSGGNAQQSSNTNNNNNNNNNSGGGGGDTSYDPPVKLQCTTQHNSGTQNNEGITKFSLEIVQQLEFTTSAANSQPQQISTNVTVKTHANASVKSDVVNSPKSSNPPTPLNKNNANATTNIGLDSVGTTLVECIKQEPDNDFADLDQCAAALEKDAGAGFGGFSDLIGEDTNDEIITSDALNDLISDISNYPELMKDFDFEDKECVKTEECKTATPSCEPVKPTTYNAPPFELQKRMAAANAAYDFPKTELSPAAQTLKQMAEQHQHKNQMGLSYNPRVSNVPRSPYSEFQYASPDFTNSPSPTFKNNFQQQQQQQQQQTTAEMIKTEMFEFEALKQRKGLYKTTGQGQPQQQTQQQYSPYNSPSHGSPGYLPRSNSNNNQNPGAAGGPGGGHFGGGTPPRPSSGHGGATLQINQAQQLHISQQGHGHNIQVSAGQHLQLSGELKGNVSIAAHQGLHFNQQNNAANNASSQNHQNPGQNPNQGQQNNMMSNQQQQQQQGGGPMMGNAPSLHPMQDTYSMSQSQTINFTQQNLRQRGGSSGGGASANQVNNLMNAMNAGRMPPQQQQQMSIEQQQKLLQQQAMLRNQQQQQQQAAVMQQQQQHMVRPPPPDYNKASMMQPRYASQAMRRMPHQPIPPSGPMMRPHNMYMMQQQQAAQTQVVQQQQQQHRGYPRQQNPMMMNVNPMESSRTEWRNLMQQQQQQQQPPGGAFGNSNSIRPNFQQQQQQQPSFNVVQHQQMRMQQQAQHHGGMMMNNNVQQQQMQQMMMAQQQQQQQQQLPSIHMQQSQSIMLNQQQQQQQHQVQQQQHQNQLLQQQQQQAAAAAAAALSSFNAQAAAAADFNLEFLDNLPTTTDTSGFTEQELLSSFDADSGFSLDF